MRYTNVPLIPQTRSMSCWAASIAMILGWRNGASYSDEIIARNMGGRNYRPQMLTGLSPNDTYMLGINGFVLEAPQSYSEQGLLDLLVRYGPLWIATDVGFAHVRVLTGLFRGMAYLNDPLPINVGRQAILPFNTFMGQLSRLGFNELNQPNPIYVAHLR